MAAIGGKDPISPFDRLHMAIAGSEAYRDAIRESSPDLPDWLTPASVINFGDLRTFEDEVKAVAGQTIVDLGCGGGGPGLWVAERAGASLIGVDASRAAVGVAAALAKSRGMTDRARFVLGDLGATGLPDECADGVVSLDALMFVEPRGAALEIRRLLKPGGRLVARVVESLVDPFTPTLVRDYRPIFEEVGFTIVRHEEAADYQARSLSFFRAIDQRADALYTELGSAADVLIDEARDSLEKSTRSSRVRTMFLTAQR
jgi:ubiquinone/menaquinone biosynthesis C-methylase UbiE